MRRVTMVISAGGVALALPAPVWAHLVDARFGDFYSGFMHPLSAIEHVFPFLAAGLLAGQQGARGSRTLLVCFVAGLLVGLLSAGERLAETAALINSTSFVILGGMVALARRLPLGVLAGLAALLGASHGYANGSALTDGMLAINFHAGVVSAGVIVVSLTAGAVLALRAHWTQIAVRTVGSWIAAIGLMSLALS